MILISPTPPPPLVHDYNGDGYVDGNDLGVLLTNWGQPGFDGAALGLLLLEWGVESHEVHDNTHFDFGDRINQSTPTVWLTQRTPAQRIVVSCYTTIITPSTDPMTLGLSDAEFVLTDWVFVVDEWGREWLAADQTIADEPQRTWPGGTTLTEATR